MPAIARMMSGFLLRFFSFLSSPSYPYPLLSLFFEPGKAAAAPNAFGMALFMSAGPTPWQTA
jgi:hypothetical protein